MRHRSPRQLRNALTIVFLVVGGLVGGLIHDAVLRPMSDSGPADFGGPAASSTPAPGTSPSQGSDVEEARQQKPQQPGRASPVPSDRAPDRGPSAESPAEGGPAAPGSPRLLTLPRLEVRAEIDPVGVTADGDTEVPADADRVGWYRFGPAPGADEGSALIVGHVDSRTQGLGVLAELSAVRQGDQVTVQDADGGTVGYRITSRRSITKKELAGSGVFRRQGPHVLTLVTCTGPYIKERGGYQENLVVTAVRETS